MSSEPSLFQLLKHAQLRLSELTAEALSPHGITGRELAVLLLRETRNEPYLKFFPTDRGH